MKHVLATAAVAVLLSGCDVDGPDEPVTSVTVSSPAFDEGEPIPTEHTCDGEDVPPPLAWEGVPDDAAELAVIVSDPDAPGGEYVHWVVAGLDPAVGGLTDGVETGGVLGSNDFGELGWGGPCPPASDDAHRYVFTVYAAAEPLGLEEGTSAADVRAALEGRELARGQLVGTYDR